MTRHPASILFITLDSCRYDTFAAAHASHLKAVGPLYKAMAPGNFTFSSHAAMFVGFTPGIASASESFINPKYAKIFKMVDGGLHGKAPHFMELDGANFVEGLKRRGYFTLGSGAVGWFNPATETGRYLSRDFHHFFYPGNPFSVDRQLDWLRSFPTEPGRPDLVFLNIGETHFPYYHRGAAWDPKKNPCAPFGDTNDAVECARRQKACLEYVDAALAPLLDEFGDATVIVCADHGDCWGEDGLWTHGFHHEKVLEVPFLYRLGGQP